MQIDQPWLREADLQHVLAVLATDGEEARIAGGAVRNAVLEEAISDIDIATTRLPADVEEVAKAAGIKSVPTGIEHGTVTLVCESGTFEVTTLREDIETDGRHAKVVFGRDWHRDAERRDFTMNALYIDADGTLCDPLGGYEDLVARRVRFIGDPSSRIREDYLRILRFFRFFAWYGAFRPDAEGLMACVRLKDNMRRLSAERVWRELMRLLEAPDPQRAILWMRQTSVLTIILPETERWGVDALPHLIACERDHGWRSDPLLRLMTMIPPDVERILALSKRLKVANRVRDRLTRWAQTPEIAPDIKGSTFYKFLYESDPQAARDRLHLAMASARARSDTKAESRLLKRLKWQSEWQRPEFPVTGGDLVDQGMAPGPAISQALADLEERWKQSGFKMTRAELIDLVRAI